MITVAKHFGGGITISAVTTTAAIEEKVVETGFINTHSHSNDPLACAAGIASLDVIEGEDMPAKARAIGDRFKGHLEALAQRYEQVGDVRGRAFSASLGDVAGAIESYLKALRIREAIVATNEKDAQSRRDLAGSYLRIGAQLIQTNEAARGTDYLRNALAVYLELSSEQPTSSDVLYDLAAAVHVDGLNQDFDLQTDSNGYFAWWMDSGNSPLSITVHKAGKVSESFSQRQ